MIVNIYSPPRDRLADFEDVVSAAMRLASRRDRVLVLGDFNAQHSEWGYAADSPKGKLLLDLTERYDLTLLTRLDEPTRIGNSVSKDTSPDLTFTNQADEITWTNLGDNLRSDHYILSLSVNSSRIRRKVGQAALTDWTKYRDRQGSTGPITNVGIWAQQLLNTLAGVTKVVDTTRDTPVVDRHLLHLWEARRSLTKRWKRQRLNRKLKIRIAQLAQEANTYAQELCDGNWRQLCDSFRGTLSTKKTWHILRSMMNPGGTKTAAHMTLKLLENEFKGNDEELIDHLKHIYIGTNSKEASQCGS